METSKVYRGLVLLPRTLALAVLISLGATGCDKKSDPSPAAVNPLSCQSLSGHYYDISSPANTVDVSNNCTYTDSYCQSSSSFTVPASDGATIITVHTNNAVAGCMAVSTHPCIVNVQGTYLNLSCDSGSRVNTFVRQ